MSHICLRKVQILPSVLLFSATLHSLHSHLPPAARTRALAAFSASIFVLVIALLDGSWAVTPMASLSEEVQGIEGDPSWPALAT